MDSVAVGKEIITADSLNNITSKTNQELLQQSTYSNFNFDGVWLLNENQIASINFDGNYESHRMAPYGSEITQDDKPLLDFLNDLRVNPSNNVTYNITKNFTLDLNGAVWSTIAPDIKKPILASIIVDEDVVCEITNFRLAQANNSFFGYIGAGSEISGLKFTNVTVDSCSQPSSAIVTTTVLRGATLQDITVEYNEINTDAQNVGIISAENQGTINNCHVANSANKTLTVPSSQVAKNVGGIVGNNAGLVNNCSVGGVNMIITTTNYTDGSFNIGGIAGVTESNISNSKVYGFNLETTNKGSMYAGGVVGYIKAAALSINKCFSYANLKIITENENAYVGGISAYVSAGSTVFGCFYSTGELKAYHVGGLSAHNYGTVTQSYAGESQLTGMFVAGLAPYHGGKFIDCYTLVNMTGLNKKSYLNGFAYRPYEGCLVEHCFSNATFSGEGHYWCETSALIRATDILDWLNEYLRTGDFVNNIVLPNNGARIQYMVEVLKIAPGWIDASVDQCKGNVGNYDVFKNAWFDGVDTWNFDTAVNEANGGFPTLKNVAVDE